MDNISLFFLIFGLSNHSPILDTLMIFGARFIIYLTFLLMFILIFKGGGKERRVFILAIICLPIIVILIKAIHLFFFEPRPFVTYHFLPLIPYEQDASFPSRHISLMSAIAFAYWYFKSQWTPIFLLLLAWVAVSRVYVGVHFPIDILGGILVGIVSLIISKQILNFLKNRFFVSQSL